MGVVDFYAGKSILITGAMGFMGKALVEKLLRACPQVDNIYILVRGNKKLDYKDRTKLLLQSNVFDRIRHTGCLSKIVPINGEMTKPGLGLSESDRQVLADKTNIVFHSAAFINLSSNLCDLASNNAIGTKSMLDLSQSMNKLQSFVYISTAYSNTTFKSAYIKEEVYPSPVDMDEFLKCYEDQQYLMNLHKSLVPKQFANGYLLSKAITENIVKRYSSSLPVAIFRPSIIIGADEEPHPGWIDDKSHVTNLTKHAGTGCCRLLDLKADVIVDIVPLDIAVNSVILASWHSHQLRVKGCSVPVYNCSSSESNPITWQEMFDYVIKYWRKYPTSKAFLYPTAHLTTSAVRKFVESTIVNTANFLYLLTGQRSKLRYYHKILLKNTKFAYWAYYNEFLFSTNNYRSLSDNLSYKEKKLFRSDIREVNWVLCLRNYVMGVRKFLHKDTEESIPSSRLRMNRLYWLTRGIQASLMTAGTSSFAFLIYQFTPHIQSLGDIL